MLWSEMIPSKFVIPSVVRTKGFRVGESEEEFIGNWFYDCFGRHVIQMLGINVVQLETLVDNAMAVVVFGTALHTIKTLKMYLAASSSNPLFWWHIPVILLKAQDWL